MWSLWLEHCSCLHVGDGHCNRHESERIPVSRQEKEHVMHVSILHAIQCKYFLFWEALHLHTPPEATI